MTGGRRLRRVASFYAALWGRQWFLLPLMFVDRVVFLRLRAPLAVETVYGIPLFDFRSDDAQKRAFCADIRDALFLVHYHSPRQWRTLCRHVRSIANDLSLMGADFNPNRKECTIDYKRHLENSPDNREWRVGWLALTFVHEATHGRFFAHYIPYTRATWERIERICRAEEQRLARRISTPEHDFAAHLTDPGGLEFHRAYMAMGFWERIRLAFTMLRQE